MGYVYSSHEFFTFVSWNLLRFPLPDHCPYIIFTILLKNRLILRRSFLVGPLLSTANNDIERASMAKVKPEPNRRRSLSDPLAVALLPPPNETTAQRERRLHAEHEAKKISDGIDEMIRQEKYDKKRAKGQVKVLLLGQSESGKSTTLKR